MTQAREREKREKEGSWGMNVRGFLLLHRGALVLALLRRGRPKGSRVRGNYKSSGKKRLLDLSLKRRERSDDPAAAQNKGNLEKEKTDEQLGDIGKRKRKGFYIEKGDFGPEIRKKGRSSLSSQTNGQKGKEIAGQKLKGDQ